MAKDARSALSEDARGSIEKLIAGAVDALDAGYEIVEVRYTKEYGKFNLTVFIWHADEVTLDDCEKVHNAVSDALDAAEDLFPADYILNVSSSGLDRPIVTDDDFPPRSRHRDRGDHARRDRARHADGLYCGDFHRPHRRQVRKRKNHKPK